MPKYEYVDTYVNPQKTINKINKEHCTCTSSPCFFAKWATLAPFRAALDDYEQNLHSLIELDVCSCGLVLPKNVTPFGYRGHRNHKTLKQEPNPQFRGKVGRRIILPLWDRDTRHKVDIFWDALVDYKLEGEGQ